MNKFPQKRFFKTNPQPPVQEPTDRETFELYQLEGLYRGMSYQEWVEEREREYAQAQADYQDTQPEASIDSVVVMDAAHAEQVESAPDFLGWVQAEEVAATA